MTDMIVRIWGGRAKPGHELDYLAHLEEVVLPEIRALPGNLGAQVFRGVEESSESFMVLTYWTDLDAVTAFSGPDRDVAVVPKQAQAVLADYDRRVRHFDIVLDSSQS